MPSDALEMIERHRRERVVIMELPSADRCRNVRRVLNPDEYADAGPRLARRLLAHHRGS